MKIDLDDLERKARASDVGCEWRIEDGNPASVETESGCAIAETDPGWSDDLVLATALREDNMPIRSRKCKGAHVETLEEIDKFVEELGIDIITPAEFVRERRRLEQLFMEVYRLAPAMINPMIKCGELHDGQLVQEWAELMVLEPYLFPRAR